MILLRLGIIVVLAMLHCSDASPRIVGATVSTIEQFPYLAQLRRRVGATDNFNYHCTGALVSATHLITAAHCFEGLYNNMPQQWTIRASATNQATATDGFNFPPTQILIHADYNPVTLDKDMAVVTWQFPLWESSTVGFVDLNAAAVPDFAAVIIAGWGGTNIGGTITNPLHFAVVPTVNLMQCRINFAPHARIVTENMMCAGLPGIGSCTNDRGLPLIYNNRLAGISSWTIGCGVANQPGVFTTILADDPWLLSALGIDSNPEESGENGGDSGDDSGSDSGDENGGDSGNDSEGGGDSGGENGGDSGNDSEGGGEDDNGSDNGEDSGEGEGGGESEGENGDDSGNGSEGGGDSGEDSGNGSEGGGDSGEDSGNDSEGGGEDDNGSENGEDSGEGEGGGDNGEDSASGGVIVLP